MMGGSPIRSSRDSSSRPHGAAAGDKKPSWLSGLMKSFKLDDLDTGDILLLLIILFLFIDGDDLEMVITLGLLLLLGLGARTRRISLSPVHRGPFRRAA